MCSPAWPVSNAGNALFRKGRWRDANYGGDKRRWRDVFVLMRKDNNVALELRSPQGTCLLVGYRLANVKAGVLLEKIGA